MANEFQQAPQQPMGPQPGFQPMNPGTPQVTFQDAIQRGLAGLTNLQGRARRSEFWWYMLAVGVCSFVLNLIFGIIGGVAGSILQVIVGCAAIALSAAALVRRLQDTGKPAILAWIFFGLYAITLLLTLIASFKVNSDPFGALEIIGYATIPTIFYAILGIVILVFCCMDSNVGPNKYGPSEKYPA